MAIGERSDAVLPDGYGASKATPSFRTAIGEQSDAVLPDGYGASTPVNHAAKRAET
jgi:hypothetical protein